MYNDGQFTGNIPENFLAKVKKISIDERTYGFCGVILKPKKSDLSLKIIPRTSMLKKYRDPEFTIYCSEARLCCLMSRCFIHSASIVLAAKEIAFSIFFIIVSATVTLMPSLSMRLVRPTSASSIIM
jgi:hypothetical protein